MARHRMIAAVLGIAGAFGDAAAQTPTLLDPGSLQAALYALDSNTRIRVETRSAADVRGSLVSVFDRKITIATAGDGMTSVRYDDVRGVWLRGVAAQKGAFIGAGVAAALGGVYGYGMTGLCEVNCDGVAIPAIVLGAGSGAIIGAVAGLVIGAFVPTWKPVWSMPRPN